jgi:hypothetical protein
LPEQSPHQVEIASAIKLPCNAIKDTFEISEFLLGQTRKVKDRRSGCDQRELPDNNECQVAAVAPT